MAKPRSLRKRRRARRRGLAISTISVLGFAGFTAILVVALALNQLDAKFRIKSQRDGLAEAQAERRAHQLDLLVERYAAGLHGIARDPNTAALMRDRNSEKLAARAEEIKSAFDGAIAVRLLPAGMAKVDNSTTPFFSYACLDLLQKSGGERLISPVEVHAPNTPQAHVGIIEPVLARNDQVILGHIQLALDIRLLKKWIEKVSDAAYVELRQKSLGDKSVLIAKAGDPNLVAESQAVIWPRKGTLWEFAVWETQTPLPSLLTPQSMSIIGSAVALVALLVFFLNKSLTKTVRTDLSNLVDMAVHTARGDKTHDYVLRMSEFKEAARVLQDLPKDRAMTRERDADADADISSINIEPAQQSSAPQADPMFIDQTAMSVEEVDASEIPPAKPEPSASAAAFSSSPAASGPTGGESGVPPAEIFKKYDIRGIVGATLTQQHAMSIGKALGSEAINRGQQKIIFGRDGRLSGPELGAGLVKGLQSVGMDVIDIGMVPTPVLYYAATELANGTGVMMTGSHNPPDYNGFKMMIGGETLASDTITGLRQRIENEDFAQGSGDYQTQPMLKKYVERVVSDVKLKRALKVVVDCGNGVAGVVAPALLKELGCEVIELYCDVDGKFPNHHPDPSKPQNMQDLIEAVKVQRADVGLAFDGDGDRIGVVSQDGSIIWPDRLMMLYSADILTRNHGAKIIFDVKCSSNLTKAIWEKGGEPLMWKTGHSLIKAKLKESGALLAGEMSGHIFFKERWYGFDDALYSAARLLEILSADVRQPRVVLGTLPDAVNTPELNIPLPEGEQFAFMEKLMDQADFGNANVIMIDGIRADYEDGWGLVRASNTTPCLVLRFEGKDKDALNRVQEEFRKNMQNVDPNIQIPF